MDVTQVWLKRLTNPEPGHKAVAGERASFIIFDPIAWDLVSSVMPSQVIGPDGRPASGAKE